MRRVLVVCFGLLLGPWALATQDYLFTAARYGTAAEVLGALDQGADVAAVDRNGFTALLLAVHFNTADVVEVLLEAGADHLAVNPNTGMGVFAYVWRNPNSMSVREVFRARGVTAIVRGPATSPAASQAADASEPARTPEPSGRDPVTAPRSTPAAAPVAPRPAPVATVDPPFRVSEMRSGWTRSSNVLGDNALIVPEARFLIQNNQREDISRLTIRAEFLLRKAGGVLERLGSDTSYVVGTGGLPMRPGVQEEIRLRSGVGYVDNNSAVVRGIKRGDSPPMLVELYYREEGEWLRFLSFDLARSYR